MPLTDRRFFMNSVHPPLGLMTRIGTAIRSRLMHMGESLRHFMQARGYDFE
jgi:hypothetical protein